MFHCSTLTAAVFALICLLAGGPVADAQDSGQPVPISEILAELQFNRPVADGDPIGIPWWQAKTGESLSPTAVRIDAGVNELLRMAIANSAKVSVARHIPLIRETAVKEAVADFDWSRYVDTLWADTSEPIGSALTIGSSGATRFRDHNWTLDAGMRRRTFSGADVTVSQQLGHQNNNSTFFVPNDQATSRIVLGFTQPLMRGRSKYYNTSLVLLAKIDVGTSTEEFNRQLQSHLLEVARSYWTLYLERSSLAQKVKLYLQTREIHERLRIRQEIDAQRSQLVSAKAAVDAREADLIRAVAAVKNAETRLRALINAPELSGDAGTIEIIPADHPIVDPISTDLQTEFAIAMQNRPELRAALQSIRAAGVRLDMASHEMLPQLNLVTQTYVAGLRGDSDLGDAWVDQFRQGEPSYSIGLQYELPVGRRAASARLCRRQLEISQMREEYRNTLELVRAEVEVALREVVTSHQELIAKNRARQAADVETQTLQARWRALADSESGGFSLERLLRAQERVTEAEYEFARAQLTYNLALINLRHANGTLLSIVSDSNAVHEVRQQIIVDQPDTMIAPESQPRSIRQPVQPPAKKPDQSPVTEMQRYPLESMLPTVPEPRDIGVPKEH